MSGPSPGSLIEDWNDARGRSFDQLGTDSYTGPKNYSTGFSTVKNGVTTIDPTIRALRESSLTDYLNSTGDIRSRFLGNESAYVNSLLNPLRQSLASRRGELQRSLGLRGLGGSSFGNQSMTNLDISGQRELRDANAQAQAQNLEFLNSLDSSRLSAQNNVAQQNLEQELSALGLGQAQISALMAAFESQQKREQVSQQIVNKMLVDQATDAREWYNSIFNSVGTVQAGSTTPSAGSAKK